jgi:hypothetical protein
MSDMNVAAAVSGVQNALDAQRMATDLITRSLSGSELNQPSSSVSSQTNTTVLAKAVTGLGSKIDIHI